MKTIFITIFDIFQLKNFFYTDFFKKLQTIPLKIVIIGSKRRIDYYTAAINENGNPNIVVEGVDMKMKINRIGFLFNAAKQASLNTSSGTSFFTQRARVMGKWKKYLFYKFFNVFFSNATGHKILNFLDDLIFPPGEFQYLFDKYKPDLVFSTNLIASIDYRLLKDAKRNGVFSVSNLKSWDTTTMKGYLKMDANKLIAQNDIQKNEMIKYQQVPADKIVVLGNPGFDTYFSSEGLMTREEFCKYAHLDSAKNIIFINISANFINPFPEDPIINVDKWISEGKIKHTAQILISPRNKYGFSQEFLNSCQNIVIHTTADKLDSGAKSNTVFEKIEIYDLKNCLKHADVVISTASTITIEAALLDTPIISIGFDFRPVNYWVSSAVRNVDEHFLPIRKTGGVVVAGSPEEFLNAINNYLENRQLHKKERLEITRQQAQFLDGKSGERIAKFLISFLGDEVR